MAEENEISSNVPTFIYNALKQLIGLKSNILEIDDLYNVMKDVNALTDINQFAKKVKSFLTKIKVTVNDLESSYIENYTKFKKKHGAGKSNNLKKSDKTPDCVNNEIEVQADNSFENVKEKQKESIIEKEKSDSSIQSDTAPLKNKPKLICNRTESNSSAESLKNVKSSLETKSSDKDIDNNSNIENIEIDSEKGKNKNDCDSINLNNSEINVTDKSQNLINNNNTTERVQLTVKETNFELDSNESEQKKNSSVSSDSDSDNCIKNLQSKTSNKISRNQKKSKTKKNKKTLKRNKVLSDSDSESSEDKKSIVESDKDEEIKDVDKKTDSCDLEVTKSNENEKTEKDAVDDDKSVENDERDEKPKVGLIKCIDICKLLDPKLKPVATPKLDDSVILLSSSDSEIEKPTEKVNSNKKEEISKDFSVNHSLIKPKINTRLRNKKEIVVTNKFEKFQKLRQNRMRKKYVESSSDSSVSSSESSVYSSDSSHSSSNSSHSLKKTKGAERKKDKNVHSDYDYKNDIKFKLNCEISLPKIPVEKLKEHFLRRKEETDIERLTNMKTLKRSRKEKSSSSSSENDVKEPKKRTKLQKKINSKENSEHSNNSDDNQTLDGIEPSLKITDEPINEEDLLNLEDFQHKSDSSEADVEEKKKDKKNNTKTAEDNDDDDKKQKKKGTEKSKWRDDPLLREKLNSSESEDELTRFKRLKKKIEDATYSGTEEDLIVLKKNKTKKKIKRKARRLGSDVSSESDYNEEKSSESDKEDEKKESSSDSDIDQKKKKTIRRRIKRMKDSDESSDGGNKKEKKDAEEQSTRKKIRNVWNKDSLADSTKQAAKEEEERKKRISERQKMYNDIHINDLDANVNVDKVVLDFNEETKEELLSVHPDLVAKLKPHQAKGVQFMWTACFESLERARTTQGSGCILAHCMGLGKTLQVITLIHTLLTNSDKTKVRTVLVVSPLSTVLNWVSEFKKWLDDLDGEQVNVFDLVQYKQNPERLDQIQYWMEIGGVLVIGYDMFRNLSNPKGKRMTKKLIRGFNKVFIEEGPDLVICDEGHLLKNEKTGISIAMNRLKTRRRIVLTGTPLQNNLKEYFCMVQFVKPSLLGTYKEYLNRFVNPITNGQYTDSTPHDIHIMRKRAHVLHKMLDGIVERRDYNVLAPFLPPKHEYILFVLLTKVQIDLYREYLTNFSQSKSAKGTSYLFQDFQELQRICIHPRVLLDKSNQDRLKRDAEDDDSEGSLKDFINDDTDEKSTSTNESGSESDNNSDKKVPVTRRTRSNPGQIEEEPEPTIRNEEWWSKYCQNDELDNICHSSKIILLFDILNRCEQIGDKVLVFSQSLYSLNLIEYFLARMDEANQSGDSEALALVGGYTGSWTLGLDYFRMDGSTSCDNRSIWCKAFNNEANTRARLFLISTKAGGLGINLVAANRVIIFDVSWNPSYDIQSIYRVYRFGQTKPCYVYRFVTMGTMENKIYERQVTKQAISKRVIDEQQIDRHYNQNDLAELYAFNPIPEEERPTPLVPKDLLFADLIQVHEKEIFKYHEHNSLLENKADECLNEEERRAAWEEFENEKTAPKFNLMQTMIRNGMYETLRILVQQDNPTWTPAQVNSVLPTIVQQISDQVSRGDYSMYRRVEEKHEMRVMEQRRMQMIYQQYIQQLRSAANGNPMTPSDMTKLAQMLNAFNPQFMQQQQQQQMHSQSQSQGPGSSSSVTFSQNDPPANTSDPIQHPKVTGVVELND